MFDAKITWIFQINDFESRLQRFQIQENNIHWYKSRNFCQNIWWNLIYFKKFRSLKKNACKKFKIHKNSNEYIKSKVDLIVCKTNIKKNLFAFYEITICNKFIKLQSKNWIKFLRIILHNVRIIIKISNFLEINLIINYKLNIFDVYTCLKFVKMLYVISFTNTTTRDFSTKKLSFRENIVCCFIYEYDDSWSFRKKTLIDRIMKNFK